MKASTLVDIDHELAAIFHRRAQAVDLIVRGLVEVDTLTTRADVLLDRRVALLDGNQ